MKTRSVLLAAFLCLLCVALGVEAQPEVLDEATYTGPVATGSECITATPLPREISVTSPNGSRLTFTAGLGGTGSYLCLDGTTDATAPTIGGDLTGTPLNGTWIINTLNFGSGGTSVATTEYQFTLGIATGTFQYYRFPPIRDEQYWNAHMGDFTDDATLPDPDVDPEEDPNNARYYRASGPSGDRAPIASTGGNEVTAFDEMNATGSWAFNNTGDDTYTWFVYADGNHTGESDLSTQPTAMQTAPANQGDAFTGTANATFAYNNNAGTSYQFCANNTLGQSCGAVLFAPAGQGSEAPGAPTGPAIGGEDSVLQDFHLTVSHAQCDGDSIAFTVFLDDDVGSMDTMNVTIYDTRDGSVELLIDSASMVSFGETIWLFNRTMVAGTYSAVAFFDETGPISQDRLWAVAFNVPRGSCDPSDNLGAHAATLAAVNNLNLNINGTRIEQIHDNVTAHRLGSIEVNSMDFGTLDFGGFTLLLLYISIAGIALWHGWPLVALAPTIAIPGLWMDGYPITLTGFVFIGLLLWWLQYLSHGGYFTALKDRFQGRNPEEA